MPGKGTAAGTWTPGKRELLAWSLALPSPWLPVCQWASCICLALRLHCDLHKERPHPSTATSGEEWGRGDRGGGFHKSKERTGSETPWVCFLLCDIRVCGQHSAFLACFPAGNMEMGCC